MAECHSHLRRTVESVRSRCQRDTGSFSLMWRSSALAMPKLPSEFSKSIGFTLCGMVEEPTSSALRLLPEITERDIAPYIAVEVEHDRVDGGICVEQFRDRIVRLDLDRVRIELHA